MSDMLNPDEFPELNMGGSDNDESLVLDLSGVSEDMPGFELLPAGTYSAIIENAEFKKSKSSGNPMISWTFSLTDAQYAGRMMFYHTVLNKDSGLSRLRRLLSRCIPDVDIGKFNPSKFCNEGAAIGVPCQIKVRVQNRKGDDGKSTPSNSVTDVLAPSDSAGSFLGDDL